MVIDGLHEGEIALKALDVMARNARAAALAAGPLADKVQMQRLANVLEQARNSVRLMHFEYEDAMAMLATSPTR